MTGYQSKRAMAQDKVTHMTKDEALNEALNLALEALEAGEYYIDDLEAIVYAADDIGTHEDRAKMQAAITVLRLEIDALNMASKPALAEQPAQRTWVDLPDDVMWSADYGGSKIINLIYAKAIQSKLKERNA